MKNRQKIIDINIIYIFIVCVIFILAVITLVAKIGIKESLFGFKVNVESNIPDLLNSAIGLPVTVVSALLALTLAKIAYEITEKEFKRDNSILFLEKEENLDKIFSNIAISISRIIDMSESYCDLYIELSIRLGEIDPDNPEHISEETLYKNFYNSVRCGLNNSGYFDELRSLEMSLMLVQSNSLLRTYFEKRNIIPNEAIRAIRNWGALPDLGDKSDSYKGKALYKLIHTHMNLMLFKGQSSFYLDYASKDVNIDPLRFSLVFFGCQFFSHTYVFYEITNADCERKYNKEAYEMQMSIDKKESQYESVYEALGRTKEEYIAGEQAENEAYGIKQQCLKFNGVNILYGLMLAIPTSTEICRIIKEYLPIEYDQFNNNSNPSDIIKDELGTMKAIICDHNIAPEMFIKETRKTESKNIAMIRNHYNLRPLAEKL